MADNLDFRVRHGLAVTNTATIESGLNSASTDTGALRIFGGVGIAKDVFIGGLVDIGNNLSADGNFLAGGTATIESFTNSTNTSTGALRVYGGAGINGNVNIGGYIKTINSTDSSNTTTGALIVEGGAAIAKSLYVGGDQRILSLTDAGSTTTGALVINGGLAVGKTSYLGGDVYIGGILYGTVLGSISTATNLLGGTAGQIPYQEGPGDTGFFGPGTAGQILVSAGPAAPVYTNTSSIHIDRSNSSNNLTGGGAGTIPYQDSADSTVMLSSGAQGALLRFEGSAPKWDTTATLYGGVGSATTISGQTLKVTSGGIGVAGNSYFWNDVSVEGILTINGNTVFNDTVTFNGTATYVYSSNSVLTDSLLVLHANSSGAWTFSDNLDIGIKGDYYDTVRSTATSFFLGFVPEERYLIFLVDGVEASAGNFTGTYGDLKLNTIRLVSTQTSTSSDTGALVVPGGIGVAGDINLQSGRKFVIGVDLAPPLPNTPMHLVGNTSSYFQAHVQNISNDSHASSDYVATNNIGNDENYFVNLGIASSTFAYPDFSVAGPNDSYLFAKGGNLRVATGTKHKNIEFWIGGTGNTSTAYESTLTTTGTRVLTVDTSSVIIHNFTQATSTASGALQIRGGIGIGGDLHLGGTFYGNVSVTGEVTTATNLAGGTPGQVPYQSTGGITSFYGPGTAGQYLRSNGAAAPSYVDTATIYVGYAVTATNVNHGNVGQIVFQADAGTTAFVGTGTLGQLLVSQGTTSTGPAFISTANIYVNNSVFTDKVRGGTAGQILYQSAADTTAFTGEGTAGQLLMSRGASALGPEFVTTGSIYVGRAALADLATLALQANNATTATNLAGGAPGSLPYQSGTGTTAFLPISTASYILLSDGNQPIWATQSGLGAGFADTIKITNNTSTTATHYLTFVNTASNYADMFVSAQTGITFIPSQNFVGIGTANPAYTLDVNSTTNAVVRAFGTTTGKFIVKNSSNEYSVDVSGSTFRIYDETNLATRVRIDSNGNFGINTVPAFRLDVGGEARISGVTTVTNATTATNTITGALQVQGGIGVGGNIYTSQRVGYVNTSNVSRVYQYYNAVTDSLDTVFE